MSVEEPDPAAVDRPPQIPGNAPGNAMPEPASPQPQPAGGGTVEQSRESALRTAVLTYFPMFIATLSLLLSIYQGYLFHASIDLMEKNVARGEYTRTCREIITTYFDLKQKVAALMPAADRGNIAGASRVSENSRLEAQATVAKFGGLGTYLANFQTDATRASYTDLTRTLGKIVEQARTTQLADIDKLFEPADKLFAAMNEDCVRLSRAMRM
jgi:hypothetical protein